MLTEPPCTVGGATSEGTAGVGRRDGSHGQVSRRDGQVNSSRTNRARSHPTGQDPRAGLGGRAVEVTRCGWRWRLNGRRHGRNVTDHCQFLLQTSLEGRIWRCKSGMRDVCPITKKIVTTPSRVSTSTSNPTATKNTFGSRRPLLSRGSSVQCGFLLRSCKTSYFSWFAGDGAPSKCLVAGDSWAKTTCGPLATWQESCGAQFAGRQRLRGGATSERLPPQQNVVANPMRSAQQRRHE